MSEESPEQGASGGDAILQGNLRSFTLASLLDLSAANAVDACLTIAQEGEIWFRDGQVVSARSGVQTGLPALYALFFFRAAGFTMTAGAPSERAPLGTAAAITQEAERLVGEWERLSRLVLQVTPAFNGSSETLPVDDLLLLLDGSATVIELVTELEYSPSVIIHDLLQAIDSGLVEVVDEARRQRTPKATRPRPQDFFELLDRGRELMRSGDLVRAEIALRRAVRAQPDNKLARQNLRRVVQLRSISPDS
ncbi:MAG: DUF4388 domain-containing protein [Myxococcales bacterium]|nr:DUF4388 domain-containing protein [Myxococcales bacterium]